MKTDTVGSQAEFYGSTTTDAKNYATVMDYNGDAKPDLLIPVKSGSQYKWYVIYHQPHEALISDKCFTEDLYNDYRDQVESRELCIPEERLRSFNFASKYIFSTPGKSITIMDVNGDALQDVLYLNSGRYYVKLNGKKDSANNVNPGDFYEGYNVIDDTTQNAPYDPLRHLNSITYSEAQSGFDVNGDGRSDLVVYRNEKTCNRTNDIDYCDQYTTTDAWQIYLSNGHKLVHENNIFSSKSFMTNMKFADFNGDGLSDLLYADTNNKWYVRISNGASFLSAIYTGITESDSNKIKVLDYDSDNQADITYYNAGWQRKYFSSAGTYFLNGGTILTSNSQTNNTENNNPQLADLNGDGQLEFLLNKDQKWFVFQRYNTSWTTPDVINEYVSGHGLTTKIHYKSGKNQDVYSRGQEVSFPVLNMTPNGELVSQVDSDDGLHGTLSVQYKYAGLRAHTQGHGMLGYSSMVTIDKNNDDGLSFITKTSYNQGFNASNVVGDVIQVGNLDEWRFIGMPLSTTTKVSNGTKTTLLSKSINQTINYKDLTPSNNSGSLVKPHFAYIQSTEDTSYTLNTAGNTLDGNLSSIELQATTSNFVYDNYGNITSSEVNVSDHLSADVFTTTTYNYYGITDAGTHCNSNVVQGSFTQYEKFGRLTCTIVTKSRPNMSSVIKKAAFGYNNNGVLVNEETSPGTELASLKSKTFTSDGNLKTSTISGKNYNPENNSYQDAPDKLTVYSYDASDKRFPSSVKNSLLHTKLFTYNSLLGLKKTESVNGVTNTFYYDDFGSIIGSKSGVTGVYSNINYLLCASHSICDVPSTQLGTDIFYAVQKKATASPETVEYFDVMGRKVATRKESFTAGTYIYTGTIYNPKGNVKRTYAPSNFAPKKDYGSVVLYDVLDRPISEVVKFSGNNIESGATSSSTLITYNNREVSSLNALLQTKVEKKNAVGEIISINDATANNAITYQYYADGKLHKTTDIHNNIVSMFYDIAGNKIQTIDPDMGSWEYKYNSSGQMAWQRDAKLQETWFYFDILGRKSLRIDNAKGSDSTVQSSCWLYDSNYNGSLDKTRLVSGKRTLAQCSTQPSAIEDKAFSYDTKGRPLSTYTKIKSLKEGDVSYFSRVYYNNVGKIGIKQNTFDEGFSYYYNSNGYKAKTYQASNGKLLTNIISVNEQGLVNSEKSYPLSGTIHQTRTYNAGNGTLVSTMTSGDWGTISEQNFKFDKLGNLKKRTNKFDFNNDGVLNVGTEQYVENFTYDEINRVEQHKINDINYEYFCYDNLGNITHKKAGALNCNSASTHTYGYKPHQLSKYGGVNYDYDNNGSLKRNGDRSIDYSAFGKATKITKSPVVIQFQYGVNRSRFERVDTDTNGFIVTHYQSGVEHIYENAKHEKKFYEGNLLITKKDGKYSYKGLVRDHLNSVVAIVDEHTFFETHYRYDAFGKQYTVTSKNAAAATKVAGRTYNTQRGFTGHEMLASVNIIHMNGRIYDPTLGRFLQADPFVQAPKNSQSYNRYAYVVNNPLKYTDPSGYLFGIWAHSKAQQKTFKALGPEASGILIGFASAACGIGAPACARYLSYNNAIAQGASTTGALRASFIAAASVYTFQQIGAHFNGLSASGPGTDLYNFGGNYLTAGQVTAQIASHAVTGGVISTLSGGKFGHGFFAAGVTKGMGGAFLPGGGELTTGEIISGTVISAVIGGTASEISGGKFKNGASTAAFQYLFNQASSSIAKSQERAMLEKMKKGSYMKFLDDSGTKTLKYGAMVMLPGGEFVALMRGSLYYASRLGTASLVSNLGIFANDVFDGNASEFDMMKISHDSTLNFASGRLVGAVPIPFRIPVAIYVNAYSNTFNFISSFVDE